MNTTTKTVHAPTSAYRGAAMIALAVGTISYCIGLFNAEMALNEKGYYLSILLYGLFSAVSLQKTVRDKQEHIEVSDVYYMLSWLSLGAAVLLLTIGLYNAELLLSEKGFFGMAYTLSLFASITVQKNIRDMKSVETDTPEQGVSEHFDLEEDE
ncbi:inner membrane protein YiaA [Agaribacter flavus]|uniref:Inner membrane protein YiaA n=1 Tax=Agaribacter flavus TaxID=1902781 RepID=A0ABV7FL96_9ALTE